MTSEQFRYLSTWFAGIFVTSLLFASAASMPLVV